MLKSIQATLYIILVQFILLYTFISNCAPEDIPSNGDNSNSGNLNRETVAFITDNLPPELSFAIGLGLIILGFKIILHGEQEAIKNAAAHALYNKPKIDPKAKADSKSDASVKSDVESNSKTDSKSDENLQSNSNSTDNNSSVSDFTNSTTFSGGGDS